MPLLFDLNHTFAAARQDVLLVSPSGVGVMLLSDAGAGIIKSGQPRSSTTRPRTPPQTGGNEQRALQADELHGWPEAMPAPPPPGPSARTLSAFNGESPNGLWSLYVLDDAGGDSGQIAEGFRLSLRTTEGFGIADPGPAADYPATVDVAGRTTPITNLRVRVNGIAHSWPDDLDLLLVGPGGQAAMLMSDAGGGGSQHYESPTLTFSDAAPQALEDDNSSARACFARRTSSPATCSRRRPRRAPTAPASRSSTAPIRTAPGVCLSRTTAAPAMAAVSRAASPSSSRRLRRPGRRDRPVAVIRGRPLQLKR